MDKKEYLRKFSLSVVFDKLRNDLKGVLFIDIFRFMDHSKLFWVVELIFFLIGEKRSFYKGSYDVKSNYNLKLDRV